MHRARSDIDKSRLKLAANRHERTVSSQQLLHLLRWKVASLSDRRSSYLGRHSTDYGAFVARAALVALAHALVPIP